MYIRSTEAIPYRVGAERRTSTSSLIGTVYSTPVTLTPNTWTRLTFNVPVTPTMASFTFIVYSSGGALNTNSTIDFDAAMVTEGSNLYEFSDGNSPDWTWNGTQNNSTSTGPPL